jgi:hypothetical protein
MRLSLKYQVMSPLTAFLAISKNEDCKAVGELRTFDINPKPSKNAIK